MLRHLDAPLAVALALPRKVALHVRAGSDRAAWDWAERLRAATAADSLTVKVVGD